MKELQVEPDPSSTAEEALLDALLLAAIENNGDIVAASTDLEGELADDACGSPGLAIDQTGPSKGGPVFEVTQN